LRALNWLTLIENAGTAALDGAALDEVLEMLSKAPKAAVPLDLADIPAPNGGSRMMFRLLLVQYARKDTGSHLKRKWAYRSTLLGAGLKYALGVGKIPPLQDGFKAVPFGALEKPFGGLSAASEEVLLRHLRVKIQGIHYCGPAYYNVPFIEGFRHLALLLAATLWMARWLAAGDGRDTLLPADVLRALAVTDHHHGYTPAFGSANFRRRVRTLASAGHIQKLVAWYAR
jgi:lysine-N-methylase